MAPHLGLSSSTTTPAKAAHYSQALSAALNRGAWSDAKSGVSLPGSSSSTSSTTAANSLEWSEAVRKWAKHTGGEPQYVHRLHAISAYYRGHHQAASSTSQSVPDFTTGADAATESRFSSSSAEEEAGSSAAATSKSAETAHTSGSSFVYIGRPNEGDDEHQQTGGEGGDGVVVLGPPVSTESEQLTEPRNASAALQATDGGVTKDSASADTVRPAATTTTTRALPPTETVSEEKAERLGEMSEKAAASRQAEPEATQTRTSAAVSDLDGDDDLTSLLRFPQGSHVWVAPERREEVQSGLRDVESMLSRLSSTPWARPLQLLLAFHHHALGQHEQALRILEQVSWTPPTKQDDGWCLTNEAQTTDLVRGKVIQGLCYELVGTSDTQRALEAYEQANELMATVPNSTDFASRREALRWLSKALARATVISGRSDDLQRTLRFARAYHTIGRDWPIPFRPKQRQAMLDIYLQALQADRPPTPILRWQKETRSALIHGQRLLGGTTTFPRAGETNWAVINFIERSVELWEDGGMQQDDARQVISILWWAMTLTFNSHALLRHLTRLLCATEAFSDARRTFELYVQLVLKARQTAQPDTPLRLEARPDDRPGLKLSAEANDIEGHVDPAADSDEDFVEAIVFGARLLAINLAQAEEAWRYAVLAGDVVTLSSRPLSARLRARVEEAKGIVRAAMAVQCNPEPEDRPKLQMQAIQHLQSAIDLHSDPATLYHLAYVQAEARDLASAVDSVRSLLEQDPAHVNGWHLLALLLSGQRDFVGALKAIEVGIESWEAAEEVEERKKMTSVPELPLTVGARDFGAKSSPAADAFVTSASVISEDRIKRPHRSHVASLPSTPSARLANVIQLRMTEAVILEKIDGPAQAMIRQQQTFSYFSERSPTNVEPVTGPDLGESFVRVEDRQSVPSVSVEESPRKSHRDVLRAPGSSFYSNFSFDDCRRRRLAEYAQHTQPQWPCSPTTCQESARFGLQAIKRWAQRDKRRARGTAADPFQRVIRLLAPNDACTLSLPRQPLTSSASTARRCCDDPCISIRC